MTALFVLLLAMGAAFFVLILIKRHSKEDEDE